jgi:hypothetical protein
MDLGALTAPSLKVNMFAKDFKKQVLAADALKAWITSKEDEVRTFTISRQNKHLVNMHQLSAAVAIDNQSK